MKKREGYKLIIPDVMELRIKNKECPGCGLPKSEWKRRKDWRCCSVKCSNKLGSVAIFGWQGLRIKAFKRDNFTCVKCGRRPLKSYCELGRRKPDVNTAALVGDHIIPIALGGPQWDINNVQTLCIKCDKIKTAQDFKDIAKQRKIEKVQSKTKSL